MFPSHGTEKRTSRSCGVLKFSVEKTPPGDLRIITRCFPERLTLDMSQSDSVNTTASIIDLVD